ncbi:hypothetical protein S58_47900 [Bradyrhizobium oligotrophicum S58]|uniref:Uncharacterized protein n=1 Tax=Bradyrhizobium oligotrophicum S58 TaxID=1245469 RepID=M4ZAJ7_9BRAD|nr:hypothetical protein S58_47900 [Bradyrhizobium oligotrophicum S58]
MRRDLLAVEIWGAAAEAARKAAWLPRNPATMARSKKRGKLPPATGRIMALCMDAWTTPADRDETFRNPERGSQAKQGGVGTRGYLCSGGTSRRKARSFGSSHTASGVPQTPQSNRPAAPTADVDSAIS